ncbi:MAG: HXXEE domain-containing protein [Blastocatellia bacterium]
MADHVRTNSVESRLARQHGWAWVALCIALALHAIDEATTDFLSVYNPAARAIRDRFPFLAIPIFSFRVWLTGLIVAVGLLLVVSPFAFRGSRWMRFASYPFATLMLVNGLGHVAGSLYLQRLMPGVYSAPLLLAASIYLLVTTRHLRAG